MLDVLYRWLCCPPSKDDDLYRVNPNAQHRVRLAQAELQLDSEHMNANAMAVEKLPSCCCQELCAVQLARVLDLALRLRPLYSWHHLLQRVGRGECDVATSGLSLQSAAPVTNCFELPPHAQPSLQWSFTESLYFVIILTSTVGYGDYAPSNHTSRVRWGSSACLQATLMVLPTAVHSILCLVWAVHVHCPHGMKDAAPPHVDTCNIAFHVC